MSNSGVLNAPAFLVDEVDMLGAQKLLRAQLLESPAIRYKSARDLAAHMLLHLDDVSSCWGIATQWLLDELGCQRVDTGFGRPENVQYFPGFAEAKSSDYEVPSFGGFAVDNRDPIMRAMWSSSKPIAFANIKEDRRVTPALRKRMSGARTKSKFGAALRTHSGAYGLICADWTEHLAPHRTALFECFEHTVNDVLSPIVFVAQGLSEPRQNQQKLPANTTDSVDPDAETIHCNATNALTRSEVEVARLVVQGLSYKEIAGIRARSFSTVDHQLRSIRRKMGVASTAALIRHLSSLDGFRT